MHGLHSTAVRKMLVSVRRRWRPVSKWLESAPAFRWDQLRRIGNSRTAQATSAIPVLTYVFSYMGSIRDWMLRHSGFDVLQFFVSTITFYEGLLMIAFGSIIYGLFVPHQVAKHADDVEYYEAEKGAWWNAEYGQIVHHRIPKWSRFRPDNPHDRVEVIRKFYRFLCCSRGEARIAVSVLYVLGFSFVSWPIIKRIVQVVWMLIRSPN